MYEKTENKRKRGWDGLINVDQYIFFFFWLHSSFVFVNSKLMDPLNDMVLNFLKNTLIKNYKN